MPSTLAGLITFVSLLTPGFVYLARLESRLPAKTYSTLRETAAVVTVSVATNAIVVGAFGIVRMFVPTLTPNVGEIIRTPGTYAKESYVSLGLWSVGLLCASAALAAVAAVPPRWLEPCVRRLPKPLAQTLKPLVDKRHKPPIRPESSWGAAFRPDPSEWESEHKESETRVHVGIRTSDGSYLYGPQLSFNPQLEENKQRDLSIGSPVFIRTASSDEVEIMDADVLVVSADQIKTISVHYLPENTPGESYTTMANFEGVGGDGS